LLEDAIAMELGLVVNAAARRLRIARSDWSTFPP
jgi:hypothetical protein